MTKTKNNAVGYGSPPKHSQFKKGSSGNKKGRPKGARNFATLFHKEMNQKVAISENGQRRMITKAEAAIKQLMNSAAKGNPKSLQAMIGISREMGGLKLPNHLEQPKRRRFTLRVFDKDLMTGETIEVYPGTTTKVENADR
jgi:hypothetical protein